MPAAMFSAARGSRWKRSSSSISRFSAGRRHRERIPHQIVRGVFIVHSSRFTIQRPNVTIQPFNEFTHFSAALSNGFGQAHGKAILSRLLSQIILSP